MKPTMLKQVFSIVFSLFLTLMYAQTNSKSNVPVAVQEVLQKVQSFYNLAVREPIGLLNNKDIQILTDYYQFFFSSRRRHTRCGRDWSSDVCSSDLVNLEVIRLSAARIMSGRKASLKVFPDVAANPNSLPFSRVLANAGSFLMRSPSTPPFSRAKYPSFDL